MRCVGRYEASADWLVAASLKRRRRFLWQTDLRRISATCIVAASLKGDRAGAGRRRGSTSASEIAASLEFEHTAAVSAIRLNSPDTRPRCRKRRSSGTDCAPS